MDSREISAIRRRRLTIGKLQDALEPVPDDASLDIEFPSLRDPEAVDLQVVVGAGFGTYRPGGPVDPSQPQDRVASAYSIQAEYPSGSYYRPVTEAEDYDGWVRNAEVLFDHEVESWNAGQLKEAIRGLPRHMHVNIDVAEQPGGDFCSTLFIADVDLGFSRDRPEVLTLVAEELPLELALEQTPPSRGGMSLGF